jgi:hypothetical protein
MRDLVPQPRPPAVTVVMIVVAVIMLTVGGVTVVDRTVPVAAVVPAPRVRVTAIVIVTMARLTVVVRAGGCGSARSRCAAPLGLGGGSDWTACLH